MVRETTMFPRSGNYRKEFELRDYISGELELMAQRGLLYLTDVMQHPDPLVVELAGQVILGQEYREDGHMEKGLDVPPELASYRVRLRCINGHKVVRWKGTQKDSGRRYGRHSSIPTFQAVLHEKAADSDGCVSLSAADAWRALRFCGKECRVPRVKRATAQEKLWLCEEVNPAPVGDDAPSEAPTRRRRAP